jgi:hypothetical protein
VKFSHVRVTVSLVVMACFAIGSVPSRAQLKFSKPVVYDRGVDPSIATLPSGLFVEVHRAFKNLRIWYRIGRLNGTSVTWGESQSTPANGNYPRVAMNSSGLLIVIHSGNSNRDLYYQVGQIDPNAGVQQSITWLTDFEHWDAGVKASIAINDDGWIVGAHEGSTSSNLYYRVGRFKNVAAHDYRIDWVKSGRYGSGSSPAIALINYGQRMVMMNGTSKGAEMANQATWIEAGGSIYKVGDATAFPHTGSLPSVAMTESGLGVAVYSNPNGLWQTTGQYQYGGAPIKWNAEERITSEKSQNSGVTVSRMAAIEVDDRSGDLWYSTAALPGVSDPGEPAGGGGQE